MTLQNKKYKLIVTLINGHYFIEYYLTNFKEEEMDYQQIIKDKGLKQKWIADRVGVSGALLSMYFKGKSGMSPEHVKKLKNVLGLN